MQEAVKLNSTAGAFRHLPCVGRREVRAEAPVKASAIPDRIAAAGFKKRLHPLAARHGCGKTIIFDAAPVILRQIKICDLSSWPVEA